MTHAITHNEALAELRDWLKHEDGSLSNSDLARYVEALQEIPEPLDPRRERLEAAVEKYSEENVNPSSACEIENLIDEAIKMMDEDRAVHQGLAAAFETVEKKAIEAIARIAVLEAERNDLDNQRLVAESSLETLRSELEGRGVPYDELMGKLEEASRERDTWKQRAEDVETVRNDYLERWLDARSQLSSANARISELEDQLRIERDIVTNATDTLREHQAKLARAEKQRDLHWSSLHSVSNQLNDFREATGCLRADAFNETALPELTDELLDEALRVWVPGVDGHYCNEYRDDMREAAKVLRGEQ